MNRFVHVVEDDEELRDVIVRGLSEEGFDVAGSDGAQTALERHAERPADVFVIDIGLGDADGRDLCQALRARGIRAPVLFLTALDATPDRISGFRAGGDDYVTKPFAFSELIARLHALLRRADTGPPVDASALQLDPTARTVHCGEKSVELTQTEYRILGALAGRPGETLRRGEIVGAAWPPGAMVSENTIDAYIARLRRKLRSLPGAPQIVTARGVGYVLR
ncbi:MAG TPA: response regulator transcription factor [Gaiellales bacterium]|jgi:two-component system response regulator MprA|nr:response regulator transcription factor [Gaiellales bacterium]